jgi:hypothetical protein
LMNAQLIYFPPSVLPFKRALTRSLPHTPKENPPRSSPMQTLPRVSTTTDEKGRPGLEFEFEFEFEVLKKRSVRGVQIRSIPWTVRGASVFGVAPRRRAADIYRVPKSGKTEREKGKGNGEVACTVRTYV